MKRISFFLLVLVLTSVACGLPTRDLPPTPTAIPVDPAQAQALEDQLATAAADLEAGNLVTLTITDTQLTSYFARQLGQQSDVAFLNPQVRLTNGNIEMSGDITIEKLTAQATVVFSAYVANGRLTVEVQDAKLGALPLPDRVITQINDTMNTNMQDLTSVDGRRLDVQSVTIGEGVMTLTGQMAQP
ncbi:MAG: hypothetical protein JW987_13395 [Anaerolineaceae bacterium]|nr:hypothetical protein [Anaerolineaceae bacterium]